MRAQFALSKGVHWYSFSDHSGCVLFDAVSGDTLSISLTEHDLFQSIENYHELHFENEFRKTVDGLIQRKFLTQC